MVAILPLIILLVRLRTFLSFSTDELPALTEGEVSKMKSASKTAVAIFICVTLASFVPYGLSDLSVAKANLWSFGIAMIGLIVAALFDRKAERIKRRGIEMSNEQRFAGPGLHNTAYDPDYVYFGGLTEQQRLANQAIQDEMKRRRDSPLKKGDLHPYLNVIRASDDQTLTRVIEGNLSPDDLLKGHNRPLESTSAARDGRE